MELDFGILAERAESTQAGPIHFWGAGFESVGAPLFPATYQFFIVVKLLVTKDEVKASHGIRLEVTNPTGEIKEIMSNPDAKLPEPRDWELPIYATFVFGIAFTFLNAGRYTFRFVVDNTVLKSWPVVLMKLDGIPGANTP